MLMINKFNINLIFTKTIIVFAIILGPVNDKAVWQVLLDPMEGSNAYEITAMLGANKVTISDVLFGDVWFCSGQSNMQFSVFSVSNATAL